MITVMESGADYDDQDELSRSLYAARHTAGLGQIEAARRAKTSQNKISRVENGKGLLTIAEAVALLTVYGVHGEERRRIMALVTTARAGHVDSRVILQRGAHHFQERIRQLDEQSRLVRSFAPTAVLGILQTRPYAEVVFTQRMNEEQAAWSIASRMERHRMMDDPSRQWVLLQTEGALRWNLGGSSVMIEQIERIAAVIDRPNVQLGIIPWHASARVLPLHGFHLYDHRAVVVGTRSGTAIMGERDVLGYETLFGELEYLAAFNDEARVLLGRIAEDYRSLGPPPAMTPSASHYPSAAGRAKTSSGRWSEPPTGNTLPSTCRSGDATQ